MNGLIALTYLTLSYLALYAGAFVPQPVLFAIGLVTVLLSDKVLNTLAPRLTAKLQRAQFGPTYRAVIRDAAILVFVARSDQYNDVLLGGLIIGLLAVYALRGLLTLVIRALADLRRLPLPTRNVDLGKLRIPDAPPAWLTGLTADQQLFKATIPLAIGVVIDELAGTTIAGVILLGVTVVAMVAAIGVGMVHHQRNKGLADKDKLRAEVHQKLREYRPEVLLYFSLGEASGTTYQVDSWLEVLGGLRHKAMILVRERRHVTRIAPTHLPIVGVPRGPEVMDLELPDLKVVFYVGNTGNNIHMLRTPGIRHVFVGHGDSDKVASANPYSRVYDEVWVAGLAGRERYRKAGGAVSDSAIVEVGRPQLAAVRPANPDRRIFTVLYAPTWEGWSNDLALSSVPVMGLKIIRTLLALSPNVRVIYKPHPLTGYQDPVTKRVSAEITAILEEANRKRATDPAWTAAITAAGSERKAAVARLAALEKRIEQLSGPAAATDDTQVSRDTSTPDTARHAELLQAEEDWKAAHWASEGWWAHRTVVGPRPDLYSCFNEADMMIADISAVVSDFVASGKPYVVSNLKNEDEAAFRANQTVAGGAYLLGPKAAGLAELVQSLQLPEPVDPMEERRERLRDYLLGPVTEPMERFNDALDDLIAKPYPVYVPGPDPLEVTPVTQ
ncbi:hypothetical protein [Actinoplanes sp. NPDC051851]|uniref:hypothetical protein n=1 Tax=Actinoplanes sp. NPDC051851 TaxID=3154753 RepID=UPI00341831DF